MKIKKLFICFLVFFNIFIIFNSSKTYAASSKSIYENGFSIEINEIEKRTIQFEVTNLNEIDVDDVELELEVPEGYKIDNSKLEIDTLEQNESFKLTAKVEKDYFKVYLIVFGTAAIVILFLIVFLILSKKRKAKKVVVAMLCVIILGNTFAPLAIGKSSNSSCKFTYSLSINDERVKVTGKLSYDVFDTDSDGLPDKIEKEIGTDKKKEDTDEDGFSDYEEYKLMGTDPLEPNSQEKDTDGDGLSDYDEIREYNTDINNKDTDGDGLSDYDEVKKYDTDPNNRDTDGDTLSDGFEIEHDLNPLETSSDGKKKDKDLLIEQEISKSAISSLLLEEDGAIPKISGKAKGEMANNIYLSAYSDTAVDDNHAILGRAVLIEAEDSYVKGLTLSFDVSNFEGTRSILSLCKLKDDGTYEVLDAELEDDDLQIELEDSGVYFVMDEEFFMKNLGIDVKNVENKVKDSGKKTEVEKEVNLNNNLNLKYLANESVTLDISGQADIVFVIDTTGSMSGAIRNVKENVTKFAESLKDNYNVNINYSLIEYKDIIADGKDSTKIVKKGAYNWFVNTSDFIDVVEKLSVGGGRRYSRICC